MRCLQRRDDGFVAIEFVAGIAFLLIPIAMMVLSLPTWLERESLSRTAAREAARVYVLSGGTRAFAEDRARIAVAQIEENAGLEPGSLTLVEITGDNPSVRGGSATARVRIEIPALVLPFADGSGSAGAFSIESQHREAMDLYRSGP